jgi:transposase InsO family protein
MEGGLTTSTSSHRNWTSKGGHVNDAETLFNPAQIQRSLAFWIEGYHNRERRHSTIGSLSPINYEQCLAATPTVDSVKP